MTLLQALEQEVTALVPRVRFQFANLDEANATIFDQINTSEFPVCLILPFDITDEGRENGRVKSSAEINAIFLTRATSEQTIDKPTSQIDSEFVAPMRSLARQFINRLDTNFEFIEDDGISSVVHRSTHEAIMDAHLYGCWSVFTIKFWEELSTCVDE